MQQAKAQVPYVPMVQAISSVPEMLVGDGPSTYSLSGTFAAGLTNCKFLDLHLISTFTHGLAISILRSTQERRATEGVSSIFASKHEETAASPGGDKHIVDMNGAWCAANEALRYGE